VSTGHQTEAERIVAQIRAEAYEECARIADEYAEAQSAVSGNAGSNWDIRRQSATVAATYLAVAIRRAAAKGGAA
jgi:hypothetical protein